MPTPDDNANTIDTGGDETSGPPGIEVLPERATTYVNPETGESGLTFKQLVTQLPHLYPDIDPTEL